MKKAMTLVAIALVVGALVGTWILTRHTADAPTAARPSASPSPVARPDPTPVVPETQPRTAAAESVAPDRGVPTADAARPEPTSSRRPDVVKRKPDESADSAPTIGLRTDPPAEPTPPVKIDSEPAAEATAALPASSARVNAPALSPPPRLEPPPSSPEPTAATGRARANGSQTELASIQRVLERYQDVYDQLDASLAAPIWPRMDVRALSKVFARLKQQKLSFDNCAVALDEARATAQCTGWLTYVPQVGSDTPRREHHSWTIDFERTGGEWLILRVGAK